MNTADSNSQKHFFYLVNDQMFGPLELVDLAAELKLGQITQGTLVRQQGENVWTPFCERPEFTLVTEMPAETIARHLETKERAAAMAMPSASWLTSNVVITAGAFFMGAFALFWIMSVMNSAEKLPSQAASFTSTPTPWVKTEENGFVVEAPVPLRGFPLSPNGFTYLGVVFGEDFQIELRSLPEAEYTEEQYEYEISDLESSLLGNMQAKVISSQNIIVNGYHGYDVLYIRDIRDSKALGGARFLAGNGKLVVAWIDCVKANSQGDIERFLNSFHLK